MKSRMKSPTRALVPIVGLAFLALAGVPFSLQSCSATKNADGSFTISFAPDMFITASGLESALRQLEELLQACQTGGFERDCTSEEIHDIHKTIGKLIDKKHDSMQTPPPSSPTPPQVHPPAPQPG